MNEGLRIVTMNSQMTPRTDEDIKCKEKRGHKNMRELCLFSCDVLSINDIYSMKQNLRTLIIIDQPNLLSIHAISKLTLLQELWIVECGIKDITCLNNCHKLEKLYLYSNKIEYVPNLTNCHRLSVLWLAGNEIRRIENLRKMDYLQELNLGNNKLKSLNNNFLKSSRLCYLNLAGNPLQRLKDVKTLSTLQKLDSLIFSDPLYGECPLVYLCNYRVYTIYWLPHIISLDHFLVTDTERQGVMNIFRMQVMYYNILFHNDMNKYLRMLKEKHKKYQKDILDFKKQLYTIETKYLSQNEMFSKRGNNQTSQSIFTVIKRKKKKLEDWQKILFVNVQIRVQQLKINMHSCGNVNFVEYTENSDGDLLPNCRNFLEECLCSRMVKMGIIGIHVRKVTKVTNKQFNGFNFSDDEINSPVNEKTFRLLTSPYAVKELQDWPSNTFRKELFKQREIILTNCLATADNRWLKDSSSIKEMINNSSYHKKIRMCFLIQTDAMCSMARLENIQKCYKWNQNHSNNQCQNLSLKDMKHLSSVLAVEYEYIFKIESENDMYDCESIPNNLYSPTRDIKKYANLNEKDMYNLVKISLSKQNLCSLEKLINLPNLRELDVSYNNFREFPHPRIIQNIEKLDISFNKIQFIQITETLPMLEALNLSWNDLTECLTSLEVIRNFTPNLTVLNIENNPFQDVFDRTIIMPLAYNYIPKLKVINDTIYKECPITSETLFPCAFDTCEKVTDQFVTSLVDLTKDNKEQKTSILIQKKKNVRMKHVHVTKEAGFELDKLSKVSGIQILCASRCFITEFPFKNSLKHLIKLNLANNLISSVENLIQENLPNIKYLDVTDNLITSLLPMGSFDTLSEFYCGHNRIDQLSDIENIKTWHDLRVIDFFDNSIDSIALCRSFIVLHLINIECVSGHYIGPSDILDARQTFGNVLNKNMLMAMRNEEFTNIRQLSIIDCFIKKVDLPHDILPHLESLDLSKNQITSLSGLCSLKKLHTLRLSHNCLNDLQRSEYFNNDWLFPNISTLYLDHNNINTLMDISCIKMPELKFLFLQNNNLQDIRGMKEFPNIESLVLDFNKIQSINEKDFHENNKIKFLLLENNKIKYLHFTKRLQKLENLFIANNHIMDEMELRYLESLENLKELTFVGNPLYKKVNCYILRNFHKLQKVDGHLTSMESIGYDGCLQL